ncbi:MAG TPA: phosphate ABC transporter permease PstA [Acidimicrobiales bacterium]|nr:phosphate ABC transporter permease PstA [Acidimicrobiales bacterium]
MALVNAATTQAAVERQLRGQRIDLGGAVFRALLLLALVITIAVLGVLLWDVWTGGWPVFQERASSFINGTLSTRANRAGVFQGIRGSFWIAVFTIGLAFPLGIGAAIYLEEYAPRSRFARIVDLNIRNLAGVPSVVYGILGLAIFVKTLEGFTGGRTVMAAGITLAILVLPLVIITSAEAIRAVPDSLREAGFGVGATRWEVIRHHVLPYAAPGILTGTVLSLARALGEAAPLILVGATTDFLGGGKGQLFDLGQLTERFTALPIVITTWAGRPQQDFRALTSAAIVVLLVVVLLFNSAAILLRNRYEKKRR